MSSPVKSSVSVIAAFLFGILLLNFQTVSAQTCAPLPTGQVSFWPGDNTANDFQGTNHGTPEGGVTYAPGKVGPAFSFNGTNDISIPSINVGSAFTVEMWINPTTSGGFQHLFSNYYASATNYGALYYLSGQIEYWQGNIGNISSGNIVSLNTWTHVAVTYDGNAGAGNRFARLYVNGNLVATSGDHTETFNNAVKIANTVTASDTAFHGLIDEVSLYNRALSQAEIQSIVTAGGAGKCFAPQLLINDVSVIEGNSGTVNATFNVSAIRHASQVTVNYSTADNTATAPSDYQSQTNVPLTFPADTIAQPITVLVNGDMGSEVDESFFVNLTNPVNANILDGQGVGTIINDECFTPPAGLTAWYPAENNGNDIIGGNNGTLENGATFTAGEVGQAFSFDGSNDSVLTPTLNLGTAYSVELWIYPTNNTAFQHMVSNFFQSTNYGALYFNSGSVVYYQGGGARVTANGIPLNQWTHVALTYDGSVDRLYINGNLIGTSAAHSETFNNALRFGYAVTPQDSHYQGRLDEISLYNRALTALEVQSLYSTHTTGKCGLLPNILISDVAMNEGNSGTTDFTFTVSLSQLSSSTVMVNYVTADGTANSPTDYQSTSGTVIIPPNTPSATVTVSVIGDTVFEHDENFFVNLSNPVNANILDTQGVGTIVNDECFSPPPGLVSWWQGEGNANDAQSGNNGTVENGATFTAGEVGQAFSFDGSDDSVLFNPTNIGTAYTVELWIYPTNNSAFQHLVSNFSQSTNYGALYFTGGNSVIYYQNNVAQVSAGGVPLNQWTHVALTYDGSVDRLYINGNLIGTSAAHSETFNNALRFGYAVTPQDSHYQGRLDEISLYNRALSLIEIQSIVTTHSIGKCTGGGVSVGPRTPFDFDGDRKADIVGWQPTLRNWYILRSNNNTLQTQIDWGSSTLGDKMVPADYDGDGKTDIAVWRPSEGNWYIIQSATTSVRVKGWGNSGDIPVPADYHGDGKVDLAVYRPSEGNWYLLRSSTGTSEVRGWGASGDKPVPGDYDGDGKVDLAVFRPSENNWYILQSSTNTVRTVNWGMSGDKLVPADYDGDGRTDIAVFRSNGDWHILRSSDNGITIKNWGTNSDLLAPADYDGDGRADIAVFRPSEANWYILQSSNNTLRRENLNTGGGELPAPSAYIQ